MPTIEPGDREEMLLQGILNGDESTNIEPATRKEILLAGILNGATECNIDPATREEALLKAILLNGGGGSGGSSKLTAVVDRSVTEITAGDLEGATKIGDYALYNCVALESIEIPSGVTSLGQYACAVANGNKDKTKLTRVALPDGLTSIGTNAFTYRRALTEAEIPSTVTKIESSVFSNCAGLASVTIRATTPPTLLNANAFAGTASGLKIYVPAASVDDYKGASNWSTLASNIEAIPA